MTPRSRSLSPTQAKIILALEAEGAQETTLDVLQRRAGASRSYARKLAHELVRKGWLQRLRRGRYLLLSPSQGPDAVPDADPFRTGGRLVSPYYFGFGTAAELWGLFPQAGQQYFIVTPAPDRPVVRHAAEFRFIHVSRRRFFGRTEMTRRGQTLSVSDRERTVIDCLHRPALAGGFSGAVHVLALAKPHLDWDRLRRYLDRFAERSLAWRIGFLAEETRPSVPVPAPWVRALRPRPSDRFAPLGPIREYGASGPRDNPWHIIVNVPRSELFGEGEIE